MKINKIDIMQLGTDLWPTWRPVICRIYTDSGIYGDGEAAVGFDRGGPGAFGTLKDFAGMIVGMDPLDHEVIWDKLYRKSYWGQNGGPIIFAAISALDMALWDIKGKYFSLPVYKLLGGKRRDNIRCYASQLQFGWQEERPARTPEAYAENAKKAVHQGYDAVKIDFFIYDEENGIFGDNDRLGLLGKKYLNLYERRLAAVREAVGSDVDIIIEGHSYTDAESSIQIGRLAEKYDVLFYEEPASAYPGVTKYIHEQVRIPLASGERIYSRWQYMQYFEQHSLQMIQPDIGNCGGITEAKKICDMAYTYDVGVQFHVCGTPLATAAALQLEAVIPNFVIHENHGVNLMDYNKEYCIYDHQVENGRFKIPDLPGIGNEFSPKAMEKAIQKVTVM